MFNGPSLIFFSSAEEGEVNLPPHGDPLPSPCSYLIALDYDGTLCCGDSRQPDPHFYACLRRLRSVGARWGINTGRTLPEMAEFLTAFEMQPDFLCTRERFVYTVGEDHAWHAASAHNASCQIAQQAMQRRLRSEWDTALQHLRLACPGAAWHTSPTDPLSIVARDSATMDRLIPLFAPLLQKHPEVGVQRASRFMRLSDARFNKGSVLQCVLQAWNIPPQHLFIMGDGHNDLDAFRAFPDAFCAVPEKAHPDVLSWARSHGGRIFPGVPEALLAWAKKRISLTIEDMYDVRSTKECTMYDVRSTI